MIWTILGLFTPFLIISVSSCSFKHTMTPKYFIMTHMYLNLFVFFLFLLVCFMTSFICIYIQPFSFSVFIFLWRCSLQLALYHQDTSSSCSKTGFKFRYLMTVFLISFLQSLFKSFLLIFPLVVLDWRSK